MVVPFRVRSVRVVVVVFQASVTRYWLLLPIGYVYMPRCNGVRSGLYIPMVTFLTPLASSFEYQHALLY